MLHFALIRIDKCDIIDHHQQLCEEKHMEKQNKMIFTRDEQFPVSEEFPDGVIPVQWMAPLYEEALIDYRFDVVYDERDGQKSTLQILTPMLPGLPGVPFEAPEPPEKFPLIIYIPGSAWLKQMLLMKMARTIKVCQRGFAVAIVEYRPSTTAPFPAQIEDAKTAVRFMRKHAEEYNIDPNRIAIWGDSSGGHTAVMAGITDDGVLDNRQFGEFSASVKCIVDWFGPTDIAAMGDYPSMMEHSHPDTPEGLLIGHLDVLENPELAQKTMPVNYLSKEKDIPPILIMHGDVDDVVHFNQSCRLYNKLKELDKDVTMYKLEGSGHGTGGFEAIESIDTVCSFVRKHLG